MSIPWVRGHTSYSHPITEEETEIALPSDNMGPTFTTGGRTGARMVNTKLSIK